MESKDNQEKKDEVSKEDSTKTFATGLLHLLQPVVVDCDAQMQAVFKSQNLLSDQIDTLTKELEGFMTVANSPTPSLVAPVHTLIRSKQRLIAINNTLHSIKDRLDRMEKMAHADPSASSSSIPEVFSSLFEKIRSPPTTPVKGMEAATSYQHTSTPPPIESTPAPQQAPESVAKKESGYVSAVVVDEGEQEEKEKQ